MLNFDKDYEGYITPTAEEAAEIISKYKLTFIYLDFLLIKISPGTNLLIPKVERFVAIKHKSVR